MKFLIWCKSLDKRSKNSHEVRFHILYYLISSYLISSHLISSYLILFYLILDSDAKGLLCKIIKIVLKPWYVSYQNSNARQKKMEDFHQPIRTRLMFSERCASLSFYALCILLFYSVTQCFLYTYMYCP